MSVTLSKEDGMAQVNFRIQDERLRMIDFAAKYRCVSRTEFVVRASETAAIEVHTESPSLTSTTVAGWRQLSWPVLVTDLVGLFLFRYCCQRQ